MVVEVKPCPFCGGTKANVDHLIYSFQLYHCCTPDGFDHVIMSGETEKEVIDKWNEKASAITRKKVTKAERNKMMEDSFIGFDGFVRKT